MKKITYYDVENIPVKEIIAEFSYQELMEKFDVTSQAISMMVSRGSISKDKLKILLRDHPHIFRRLLAKNEIKS